MRRILIIVAVLVVLAGVGAGVYFYFFANQPTITVGDPTTDPNLPVGGGVPTETPDEQGTVEVPNQAEQVGERLTKIDKGPVVPGVAVYATASSTETPGDIAVNYIERQSGNIFQYLAHKKSLSRISNRTLPRIQEASWAPDGSVAFARYLSGEENTVINTYALPVNSAEGYFLEQNVASLAVSSSNVLVVGSGSNGSIGTLERLDGSQPKQLFVSPLSALRAFFAGKNQYFAFTKPAASIAGYAFLINSTGNFERVAGPLPGLAALVSPGGAYALISYTSGGILKMSLLNMATRELTALPVATIADKCVWAANEKAAYCGIPLSPSTTATYPDDWYQGTVAFSDRIWKIDVAGRFAQLALDLSEETDEAIDVTAPALDPLERVLVFRNKTDGALWLYEL